MLLEKMRADEVRQNGCLRVMKVVTKKYKVTLNAATLLIRALHNNMEEGGKEFFPKTIKESDIVASRGSLGMLVREGLVNETNMGLMLTSKANNLLVDAAEVQKLFDNE